MSTIVLAGASGFIGQHLHRALTRDGFTVRTIGRSGGDARWGEDLRPVLEDSVALVNLAGRSVSCRYTKRNVDAIFASRTETTKALGTALAGCPAPPPVWINSSTIYRDARDRPQDEDSGELGTGFSVAVARAWEHELYDAPTPVRKIALRTAIVLGPGGGALNPSSTWPGSVLAAPRATGTRCSAGCTSTTCTARCATSSTPRRSVDRSTSRPRTRSPTPS